MHHAAGQPLNILHVFRAPAGGLFRHVADLAAGQAAAGHNVGILCASDGASAAAQMRLKALEPRLALGLHRIAIARGPHPGDLFTAGAVRALQAETPLHIVHGHGAKGGLIARLASRLPGTRVLYTPHGGSLHYEKGTFAGGLYLAVEKLLKHRTDAFVFESAFARDAYLSKVGAPSCETAVVHNGVGEADFRPLTTPRPEFDVAFVGELRLLKGVDVLLDALAILRDRPVSAIMAGDGPDAAHFRTRACELGLAPHVSFPGEAPARDVFARARLLAVPSLAESLPYVVLEAAAAGVPIVATRVGGIPEIFGSQGTRLIAPGDSHTLADAIRNTLDAREKTAADARALRTDVAARFSVGHMVEGVEQVYRRLLAGLPQAAQQPGNAHHHAAGGV